MIIKINEIKEVDLGACFKLIDADFILYEDSTKLLESLYKDYKGTNIPRLFAKRSGYDFTFVGLKQNDIKEYSDSFIEELREIKKYKNDKRAYRGDIDILHLIYCLDELKETDMIINMCVV